MCSGSKSMSRDGAEMKEIVLVTLAIDTETGEVDPTAPFTVNSRRRGTLYNKPYYDEPEVIAQFRPGECQARFGAEWNTGKRGLDIRHHLPVTLARRPKRPDLIRAASGNRAGLP
jgi:hypothetical protein